MKKLFITTSIIITMISLFLMDLLYNEIGKENFLIVIKENWFYVISVYYLLPVALVFSVIYFIKRKKK